MKKGQHVGGWIVDFYADGAPEPIETIRQPGEACDGDTRDGLNDAITAADWWALTAQAPGRFYVTAKHSQAPESSRSWAKVDVVNGEPKWVECDEPRFVWQTGGDGITLPGPADGYGWADKALIAFDFTFNHGCRRELVEASRLGTEARGVWEFQVSGWPALMDCGVRRAGLAGVKGHPLAVPRAIIRQREDGTPDITPRHPLADGEVFDPWQSAAETFGVDVDAVKAAAGCPDRWWFVYDYPDDGSDLVKAPTRRMAGELSIFMRGSDPPHDFDELTIEPATMDALAERCLAHEMAEMKPTILAVNESANRAHYDVVRDQFGAMLKAQPIQPAPLVEIGPGLPRSVAQLLRDLRAHIHATEDVIGDDDDFVWRITRALGEEEAEMDIDASVRDTVINEGVEIIDEMEARPTAIESALGRGTEGERRLIMARNTPGMAFVYTWADGNDEDDDGPWMATPGWWGDGEPDDVFGPDDVVIWARLPEQVAP